MVTFSWFFNNSDHKDELDEERFTTDGKVSTLNFTPTNNQDYGTLYCQGENVIGHQVEPCTFQIVPTGQYEEDIYSFYLYNIVFVLLITHEICAFKTHLID